MKTEITVRNCPPLFRFVCPKTWDELIATDDKGVRYFQKCQKHVYLCMTDAETIERAKTGRCIAREIPHESELPEMVLGEPELPSENTRESGGSCSLGGQGIWH